MFKIISDKLFNLKYKKLLKDFIKIIKMKNIKLI